jgi:plasmid stabilization system protein ParE
MRIRLAKAASTELAEARAWLNQQQRGLGKRLNDEVRQAMKRITAMPTLYPVEVDNVRKCVLRVFPYTLRYLVDGDLVIVLTVSHQKRQTDYWIDHIDSP